MKTGNTMYLIGSGQNARGLALCEMAHSGKFRLVGYVSENFEFDGTTWFQQHEDSELLLAVNENVETVSSFRVCRDDGQVNQLEHINTIKLTNGIYPCHLTLLQGCSRVVVSNYGSGTLSVLPLLPSGEISQETQIIDHNKIDNNDSTAHAHQVVVNRAGNVAYACDLGMDEVYTYDITEQHLELKGRLQLPRGSGPRHLVLNSACTVAYLVCELSCTVCTVKVDPVTHCLDPIRCSVQYSTLSPTDSSDIGRVSSLDMAAAEILLSSDNRFLYVSNRDLASDTPAVAERSSVTVFAVSADGESVHYLQQVGSRGKHPRHICFTDGGACIVVANKLSDNLVTFRVDKATGLIDESTAVVTDCSEYCREPSFILEV